MTDKELLQQWIKPFAIVPVTMEATRILVDGLRETLAHQKKEWVGLTDEEIGMLTVFDGLHHVEVPLLADFARAIEAKLKEKNSG